MELLGGELRLVPGRICRAWHCSIQNGIRPHPYGKPNPPTTPRRLLSNLEYSHRWRSCSDREMTDDPARALAQHVCRTRYADLPASAVESARRDILETFGCMLGGSGSPGIGELFAVVSRWRGRAESRVLLRGVSPPSLQAALLNASMGHALDFDDTLDTGGSIHPGRGWGESITVTGRIAAFASPIRRRGVTLGG